MTKSNHGIEEYSEATARVCGKLVAGVFRIVWAIVGGFLRGMCLLPFLRGIKNSIVYELNNPPKEKETPIKPVDE